MSFDKKLQSLRKASNLSQEDLASELGVSRQAVSKWESGNSYPEMDKLILMTKLFNCSLDELVNDEVKDSSIMKPKISKGQFYIDSLLEFITKSINMFSSMRFKSVVRCLLELCILCCVLLIASEILYAISKTIIYEIFRSGFLWHIGRFILYIILFIIGALDVIIFFQTYKIRYLDYYDKLIYEYEQEKKLNKETEIKEDKDEKKKNDVIEESKKKERVIIRDPNHRPFAFLSTVSSIIIGLFKGFLLCTSIPFIILFALGVFGFIVGLYLITYNIIFLGICICIISGIIVDVELLVIFYSFIFNRKVKIKPLFILFLVSIGLLGVGSALSFISLKNIDFITYNRNEVYTENIKYNDSLYFKPSHSEYFKFAIDNSIDDIKVDVKYDKDSYRNIEIQKQGNSYIVLNTYDNVNSKEIINKILKDLKNNKVISSNVEYDFAITVTGSEKHIKKIINNIMDNYEMAFTFNDEAYYVSYYEFGDTILKCDKKDKCVNIYGVNINENDFTYGNNELKYNANIKCDVKDVEHYYCYKHLS